MFSQASVCPQGVAHGPGGAWSWGVHGPRGAWSWGGAWSGRGVCMPACTEADPPGERRLLLRTVRILLEFILVRAYPCLDYWQANVRLISPVNGLT